MIPYFNISKLKDTLLSLPDNRDSLLVSFQSEERLIHTATYFAFYTGLPIHYAPLYNRETQVKFRPLDKELGIAVYEENVKNVSVTYTMEYEYENEAILESDVKILERSVVNVFMKILNELQVFKKNDGKPMNMYERMKAVQNMVVGDLKRSNGKIQKTVKGNVDNVIKGLEWPTGAVTEIASGLIIEWEESDSTMPGLTHHIRIFAKTR